MSQFNFGSNLTSAAQPNFSFGSKPTTTAFGAQPSGSITFGTPVVTAVPNQPPAAGLAFGSPAATSAPLTFGAPQKPQATGLTFGAPPAAAIVGTPAQPTLGGPSFGTPAQPALGGQSFGTPTQSALGGQSFGTPTQSALGGQSFGTPTQSALGGQSFGTLAQPTLGGQSFGTPAQPVLSGQSFGTPVAATASTAPFSLGTVSGLQFGATTQPVAATAALSFGLGGTATTTTSALSFKPVATTGTSIGPNFVFPGSTVAVPSASVAPTVGLGGVDTSTAKVGTVMTGRTDVVTGKNTPVPNELMQLIESFKTFVKDQKLLSSDISRGSAKPFLKVGEDIDLFNSVLSEVGNELNKNHQLAIKLKHDCAKSLHNAEMAQRTNDTPPGLQYENTAPIQYFIDLVNCFELDLQALRLQIENTDKHLQSLQQPRFLTSQELSIGMRKLHDTFVALAGRLQTVHSQVELQKEQYLNLRKYILKDPTDIFAKPPTKEKQALENAIKGATDSNSMPKVASGPSPFASIGSPFGINILPQQSLASKPPPAYPTTTNTLNFGSATATSGLLGQSGTQLGTPSLFGNVALGQSTTDASGFQLQNPPFGNKRGKR